MSVWRFDEVRVDAPHVLAHRYDDGPDACVLVMVNLCGQGVAFQVTEDVPHCAVEVLPVTGPARIPLAALCPLTAGARRRARPAAPRDRTRR